MRVEIEACGGGWLAADAGEVAAYRHRIVFGTQHGQVFGACLNQLVTADKRREAARLMMSATVAG